MRILLYTKEAGTQGAEMKKRIDAAFQGTKVEVHQTIQSLVQSLREPLGMENIAVLLADDRKDLEDLLSIQHLFRQTPMILLVPDHSQETMVIAHKLRPRFISGAQGDYGTVIEVLKKIAMGQHERR